ncbi:MAG: thiol-disulfide isomerase, partial [Candidatus Aenigmarchaeota archaeon]|nr:thiol-disulfide isomerase [Candidatus Aenigmarchaeota archaeon]
PVVQDNDYATWRAFGNNYWPRKYLIDAQGRIRYDHIGEGAYEETEMMIQALLKERDGSLATTGLVDPGGTTDVDYGQIRTPELYLGYQFARAPLGNPEGFRPGQIVPYSAVEGGVQAPNVVYLDGEWRNNADNMELVSGSGSVFLLYNSKDVNIVAGSDGPTDAEIRVDGGYLDESNSGNDILTMDGKSTSEIKNHRLYNIISSESYGAHLVEIKANSPGFRIYTFTFG